MDLKKTGLGDVVQFTIDDPTTDEATDGSIEFHSRYSAFYKAKKRELGDKYFKKGKVSFSRMDRMSDELTIQCARGWENVCEDGAELPFSTAEARRLLNKYRWLMDQMKRKLNGTDEDDEDGDDFLPDIGSDLLSQPESIPSSTP